MTTAHDKEETDPQITRTASPSAAVDATSVAGPVGKHLDPTGMRARDPGRYHILGEHGRGGLGRVSRARDLELGRDVAIKELLSRSNLSEIRFLREALITARLEHPGIVPVHEAGRWPDGTPFYAMKLVAGRPLRDLIAERVTIEDRLSLLPHVIAVADAIAYAHERNIIHRDLKPANVIVGDFGETMVIDWGLAKDLSAEDMAPSDVGPYRVLHETELTHEGAVIGTPAYMPPEQERGEQVDQRADVFAIGAMLWELCSLQKVPPTDISVRHRLLRRAGVDRDLGTILDKSLARDPSRRYPDANALASDLRAFKLGARISSHNYKILEILSHWIRRHRAVAWTTIAIAVLGASATLGYIRSISGERDRTAAALAAATTARDAADAERDAARLAQATLLLEKDATSAAQLLAGLRVSPQQALLSTRAKSLSALRDIHLPGNISSVVTEFPTSLLYATTTDGAFVSVDGDTGSFQIIEHGLLGVALRTEHGWLYPVLDPHSKRAILGGTAARSHVINLGSLLKDANAKILRFGRAFYALDNESLFLLSNRPPLLFKSPIRNASASTHYLLLCTVNGELVIIHDDAKLEHARCSQVQAAHTLATADRSYAALEDDGNLLVAREGVSSHIHVSIMGGYAISITSKGLLALADTKGSTWYLRPGSSSLEMGPAYSAAPLSVAADGDYVAWGYSDGTVIAMNTKDANVWRFHGRAALVTSVAIDATRDRLISTTGPDLRIWALTKPSTSPIAGIPSKVFSVARSPDQRAILMDAADGLVRVWTLATNEIKILHRHANNAIGVEWWHDLACSVGLDGKLLCTSPAGVTTEVYKGASPLRWLVTDASRDNIYAATEEGDIRHFGTVSQLLYKYDGKPYKLALSEDSKLLASGSFDGKVAIYDLEAHELLTLINAHHGLVTSIFWQGRRLWTSGADGALKWWGISGNLTTLLASHHEMGSLRLMHRTMIGWVANADDKLLVVADSTTNRISRFDVGQRIQRVEISPDERLIAASVPGEIIVVDQAQHKISSIQAPIDGAGYIGFVSPELLVISTGTQLRSISPSSLTYFPY